jgi:AcrR family transcriptional regulator
VPPKKGQRQARGLARQDQILDAAGELFAEHGVRATTIAAVANRVGLSEAGLLHHFPSKDALLLAVLDRADASYVEEEVYVAQPAGGLESLRRMPATARVLADRPAHTRLRAIVSAESVVQDGAARDYSVRRTEAIRRGMAKAVAEGIRRGEIRSDVDPKARATEIVAFMEGIQVQWMLDPDAVDIVAAYDSYFAALVEDLAVTAER